MRVVHRGYSSADAYGGVSYANAGVDASYSYTYVGSRLAFRGKIVRAQSVAAVSYTHLDVYKRQIRNSRTAPIMPMQAMTSKRS